MHTNENNEVPVREAKLVLRRQE